MSKRKIESSAPGFYNQILQPLVEGIKLTKEIDRLLDIFENDDFSELEKNQAYSKAAFLARKQAELMGYTS